MAEGVKFENNIITGEGRGGALLVDGSINLPHLNPNRIDNGSADVSISAAVS